MQAVDMPEKPMPQSVSINANGTMPLSYSSGAILLDLSSTTSKNFWHHVSSAITLQMVQANGTITEAPIAPYLDQTTRQIAFKLPPLPRDSKLQLLMHGEPISEFHLVADTLEPTALHELYQLTVSETRGLSKQLNPPTIIPYSRAARQGYDPKLHDPITDLHTHVSSQITGAELFDLSLKLDKEAANEKEYVTYPVELLKKLETEGKLEAGSTETLPKFVRQSYGFFPLKDEGLECEKAPRTGGEENHYEAIRLTDLTKTQRDAVIKAMTAPEDGTRTFQQVERQYYRMMSPLTRNARLTKPLLRKIAENYAEQNIRSARLATSSFLNPEWFAQAVDAIDEIENGTKNPDGSRNDDAIRTRDGHVVKLRGLIGLQRQSSPQQTLLDIERIKFLAQHPYIRGCDLMGNETNSVSDFHWALANLAMWARAFEDPTLNPNDGWNFKEDFLIRVHAGETAKNPQNVTDAVRVAYEHKVQVGAGHAQTKNLGEQEYAMLAEMLAMEGKPDPKTGEMNPEDWFFFEKCQDSNPFYRMQPLVHQVVIKPHSDKAHCVFGQDGNGMVHTSPRQLAFSALAAGCTLDDLAKTRRYEQGLVMREDERFERKTRAFNTKYASNQEFFEAYRIFSPSKQIAVKFKNKETIYIGGASGSSWREMAKDGDELSQTYIRQMAKILVRVMNPKRVYIDLGRVQPEGVTKVLSNEIKHYNVSHPTNKFSVMAHYGYVGDAEKPTGDIAETVSGITTIRGGLDAVPDEQSSFIRDRSGKAILLGGGQFTSEIFQNLTDDQMDPAPVVAYAPKGSVLLEKIGHILEDDKRILTPEDFLTRVLRDVGPGKFFETVEERDAMMRDSTAINDPAYCNKLLKEVEEEARKDMREEKRHQKARGRT